MVGGNFTHKACQEFEQDIVLLYYGECAEKEQRRIEDHLAECVSCAQFLDELRKVLPMTAVQDDPPDSFWQDYSREMRRRLAETEQKAPWRETLLSFLRPWPVPALATALVLALALTFVWKMERSPEPRPEEQAILEVLPIVENLELLQHLELLESLDNGEQGTTSTGPLVRKLA